MEMRLEPRLACSTCEQFYSARRAFPPHTRPRYLGVGDEPDREADGLDFGCCPDCWMPIDDATVERIRSEREHEHE